MGSLADEIALSGYTDRGHRIISRDHSASKMGASKSLNRWRCTRLQPILKDDKSQKAKVRLRLLAAANVSKAIGQHLRSLYLHSPLHLLGLQPRESLDALPRNRDDPVPSLGVVR